MTNHESVEAVKSGYRLEMPQQCPQDTWKLILKCWDMKPDSRPSFEQIAIELTPKKFEVEIKTTNAALDESKSDASLITDLYVTSEI